MRIRQLGPVLLLLMLATACGPVGSGTIVDDQRNVGGFDGIEVSAGIDVRLTIDPGAPPSVVVHYDDNLLDRVATETKGSTLEIKPNGSFQTTGGGRYVDVVAPDIDLIKAASGAEINGAGTTTAYRLEAASGANIDMRELAAATVEVDAGSGADVRVSATDAVRGDAASGATVTVYGNPPVVDIDTTSGADVDIRP